MSLIPNDNKAYSAACLASEQLRQAADDAARSTYLAAGGDNVPSAYPAFDASLKANVIADFRRRLVSAKANNLVEPIASNQSALAALGTGGA